MMIYKSKRTNTQYNKTTIIALVILLALTCVLAPQRTYCASSSIVQISEDLQNSIVDELEHIDFKNLNDIVDEFKAKQTDIFSINNIKSKIFQVISGESVINYKTFIAGLISGIVEKIVQYLPMLSLIIAIGILSNLLTGMKSKFSEKSTANLIHLVCFLAVVTLCVGMMSKLSMVCQTSINNMTNQINILFPILLTLMTALGANSSVGVFQPIVAILTTHVADFFKFLILPLFTLSFVFSIISNLSDGIKLDKFNAFISSLFKWCVGFVFTIFFATFTIQGISAGSFDSLSIRTTKYTIKSYIPIMGGYLSDGMDIIMSSTMLIKNATGLIGMLIIITTIISPLIDIVIFSLLLKLISAVLQPMGNSKMSNFLMSCSKSVTMLSTCIIAIGFMYLISIGLAMTTANVVM